MSIIEKLRSFYGVNGEVWDDTFEELHGILDTRKPEGYTVKKVAENFEEGSRWSNFRETVYKVTEGETEAFFLLSREIPASETQEGMDLSYSFHEVIPEEVTVIQYFIKEAE